MWPRELQLFPRNVLATNLHSNSGPHNERKTSRKSVLWSGRCVCPARGIYLFTACRVGGLQLFLLETHIQNHISGQKTTHNCTADRGYGDLRWRQHQLYVFFSLHQINLNISYSLRELGLHGVFTRKSRGRRKRQTGG